MRFITLTLQPAIDRIIHVETLRPGGTFESRLEFSVPSGKGVNTARSLRHAIGPRSDIRAAVWLGQAEAAWFARELQRLSAVRAIVAPRRCPTRLANTFLEASGRETHIKETMPPPTPGEARELLRTWKAALRPGDIVAICGSTPRQSDPRTLETVFRIARERGAAAVLADTNGQALEIAGAAGIDGIKGNAAEIGEWLRLSEPLNPQRAAHRHAIQSAFKRTGAPKSIVVTLGAKGALYLTPETMLLAAPPRVAKSYIVTATGCGDAATAGWMWAVRDRCHADELLKRIVACGTAKLNAADPGRLQPQHVRKFCQQIHPESPSVK